ncbi:MAG: TlpA disulfide reductase family protein [Desulfobacterales bacterium]|nr:TlpA disulfide reductase family protein [Desulfobacterales bacterium]
MIGSALHLLSPEIDGPFASGTPSGKTDKLLRDMGFQQYPFPESTDDIILNDFIGKEIQLSEFRGKVVFLNFWATWCPDCRTEMPSMEKLHTRFKSKSFAMVTINLKEPAERVKKFFDSYKLTFIGLLDPNGKITTKMAIRALPTTLIIDKNGKILGMALGSRPWNGKKSIALFKHLTGQ